MVASNSVLYDLCLDFKRGLLNKRFWIMFSVFLFVFLFQIILRSIWPLTCYYFGGAGIYELLTGIPLVTQGEIQTLTNMDFFVNFFPFIGPIAYAYTIMDDRRQGYYIQQVQRVGFSRYYWCKLIAGSILSGLLGAFLMVSICLLAVLYIKYNPFFREAVEYFSQYDEFLPRKICWEYGEESAHITVSNPWVWWTIGGMKYFIMGALFGLIASVLAFFTDNRVLMTACPVLYFFIEDKWLYILVYLFGNDSYISMILKKFCFLSEMGYISYGNLYHFSLLIILIVLFLNLARHFQVRTECFYMEGGNVSD